MATRRSFLARSVLGAGAALILPSTTLAASVPRKPAVMTGMYMPPVPFSMQPLYDLENALNAGGPVTVGTEIIMYGHPWSNGTDPATHMPTSYKNFAWNYMEAIWHHGSYPMVGWQSWDPSHQSSGPPNTPEWRTSVITSGVYDAYIRKFAQDARAWGHPFFLRFDHEQNGPWRFPWGDLVNGNKHGDYIRMWRHVHDIFAAEGVTNVTWVWNPNIHSLNSEPMANTFPGPGYVDWLALDGYNWGSDAGNEWQTFAQVFSATPNTGYGAINSYQEIMACAPGLPVMLCEVASATRGGPNGEASAGDWFRDMLEVQLPYNFPNIRAIVYQNTDYGDPSQVSWPIMATTEGLAAWKHGMHFREGVGGGFYGHNGHGPWNTGKIAAETYQP